MQQIKPDEQNFKTFSVLEELINYCVIYRVINTQASQRVKMRPDGTLEIAAVRASDVGNYTCSVVSPGGNETRSALLSVVELPFAPINVVATRVERISPRTINVTWVPGFDGNSPTKKFIIQSREVSTLGKQIQAKVLNLHRQYMLDFLSIYFLSKICYTNRTSI